MTYTVALGGCTPEPLVAFLKALGVLRLISEQADNDAQGWWNESIFLLKSTLDADRLVDFFLKQYIPTPILAPWNKGSGFFGGRKEGLDAIAKSDAPRFRNYREAIETVRALREFREYREGGTKGQLVLACRNHLDDRTVDWMDAAIVLLSRTDLAYPSIFGTGGNDGRLEYTNTFMSRLAELLIEEIDSSPELLRNALFSEKGGGFIYSPAGQYDPGHAGGFNQGPGIEHKDFPTNPWNLVLSLEGAVAWAAGVGRRQGVATSKRACSPFTVASRAVGYVSAQDSDEKSARAEIWTPLWERPTTFQEIQLLLREGRAEIGRRAAGDGLEFAEAAASLGVDRGISAFVRYSLVERRGKAYLALPAGRFPVREVTSTDLLEDVDAIQHSLDNFARSITGQEPPQQFLSARRGLDNAIYRFVLRGGPANLQQILAALGRLEMYFSKRDPARDPKLMRPLTGLRPAWLTACDDGSLEYRLATALASIGASGEVGPVRANLSPIDPSQPWRWTEGRGQTTWLGNSFCARLAAVLQRRMMDAERLNCPSNPLFGSVTLHCEDSCAICASGTMDETLTEELLFGLGLLNWSDRSALEPIRKELRERWRLPTQPRVIPRVYALLKLLFLPQALRLPGGEDVQVRAEPSLLPLLRANRLVEASTMAQRRLFATGVKPTRAGLEDVDDGTRLAAALLVPVQSTLKLASLVLQEETA